MDNRLNSLLNEFLNTKDELYKRYGIIDVGEESREGKIDVLVYGCKSLLKFSKDNEVIVKRINKEDFPKYIIYNDEENNIKYRAIAINEDEMKDIKKDPSK